MMVVTNSALGLSDNPGGVRVQVFGVNQTWFPVWTAIIGVANWLLGSIGDGVFLVWFQMYCPFVSICKQLGLFLYW